MDNETNRTTNHWKKRTHRIKIYRLLFEKIKFRMHYPDRKIESRKFFSRNHKLIIPKHLTSTHHSFRDVNSKRFQNTWTRVSCIFFTIEFYRDCQRTTKFAMKRARGLSPLTMRICREILLRRISICKHTGG